MVYKSETVNTLEFTINEKTESTGIKIMVNVFYNVLLPFSAYCLVSTKCSDRTDCIYLSQN